MRRQFLLLVAALAFASSAMAQSAALPSEDTVNAFMQQTFGYDSSVTWKVSSIKPSVAEGLAEVVVVVANPQGQQLSTFYVTPDGKHAMVGDMIPFGAKPFAPAAETLQKGMNGPARGPANS